MEWIEEEAVLLQNISFQEKKHILVFFTKNRGIIKLYFRYPKKEHLFLSPLVHVLLKFSPGKKSEIGLCQELSLINNFLSLRDNLACLEAACQLLKAILVSQKLGESAPNLFQLLLIFLKKIPLVKDPLFLVASFRLKILKHEGLLSSEVRCYECHLLLKEWHQFGPHTYCEIHRTKETEKISLEESNWMEILGFGKSIHQMEGFSFPSSFLEKIKNFFYQTVKFN